MKKILKGLVRIEKGQALAIVLAFLAIGGLTIATLLTYMTTGIKAGQIHERKTNEFYAADAGIELAMWNLMNGEIQVLHGEESALPQFTMNSKTVNVTIYNTGNQTFRITSIGTSDNSSATTIQAYAIAIPGFWDNEFEEFEGNFRLDPGGSYEGNVWSMGNVELEVSGNLTGHVYSTGNVKLKSGAQITGNIYSETGNVQLDDGAIIIGHVCCPNGNVQLYENAQIIGNVYCHGNVQLKTGAIIDGDVYSGSQVKLDGGTVTGTIYDYHPYEGCPMCESSSEILSWEINPQ